MNLPTILSDLLNAQAKFDGLAYANCFLKTAVVFDEGETHQGRESIRQWNERTNEKYNTRLDPIELSENDEVSILTVQVSGKFEGSPIILKYHFELQGGRISTLKITS